MEDLLHRSQGQSSSSLHDLITEWNIPPDVIKNFTENGIGLGQIKDIVEGLFKGTLSTNRCTHFIKKQITRSFDCHDLNKEKIAWLNNNTEPWQQVIEYWTATYDIRSATSYETIADFLKEWKILNDVRGEALINIDFDKKYPNINLSLKWNDFFDAVISLKKASIRDESILNDLEDLKKETEDDKKAIKQIVILCRLIPPKGRLNRKTKYSTLESIEGIVVNVEEIHQHLLKALPLRTYRIALILDTYAIYYDSYYGTTITKEELRRYDKANTTFWCTIDIEPCDPNEGRRVDGSCNNLERPSIGSGHTPFVRLLPAVFDKDDEPRKAVSGNDLPLARRLRTRFLAEGHVPSQRFTQLAINYLVFMTGDVVSQHDTVNYVVWKPYCCTPKGKTDHACVPNKIPDDDPVHRFSDIRCLNMTRPETYQSVGCIGKGSTPERITSATPLIDLSVLYGNSEKVLRQKSRSFNSGLLKYDLVNGKVWPPTTNSQINVCLLNEKPFETRCHDTPDISTNSLAGGNMFSIWFYRQHNRIAEELAKVNPCWNDEKLFITARDINIAIAVHMYFYEMLPALLGRDNLERDGIITSTLGFRDLYNPNVLPQMSLEYPYALRWIHTLQEGALKMYDTNGNYLKQMPIVNLTLRTGYFAVDDNMAYMTQGSFRQGSAAADHIVDPDIAEVGLGPHQRATDLPTNDMSKSRYFGFQPYIKYRELCFGEPIKTWDDLQGIIDPERIEILRSTYENIEDMDLMAGIWLERHIPGGSAPSTFYCLIIDQLIRNIVSDRHWYERPNRPNAFTLPQLLEIRKRTIASLLCNVGDSVSQIQPEAFLRIGPNNKLIDCSEINKFDYWMWQDPTCGFVHWNTYE